MFLMQAKIVKMKNPLMLSCKSQILYLPNTRKYTRNLISYLMEKTTLWKQQRFWRKIQRTLCQKIFWHLWRFPKQWTQQSSYLSQASSNGASCVAVKKERAAMKKGAYTGKREQRFFLKFDYIQSFFVCPAASIKD